ncbi:MAG: ATP-binding protein [Firmicutes bacterium]|nr:ATP-binding protein [Bacillota bacterium]
MERKIDKWLLEWKNTENKNPVILTGPTMVGKSYSVLNFGKQNYENYIYINLEYNPLVSNLLNKETNIDRLFEKLCLLYHIDGKREDTLLIFDNIDYYEKIINVLLRFKEWNQEYDVICIGNNVIIPPKNTSYVGKIMFKKMYKMDFEEFLIANNQNQLVDFIKVSFDKCRKNSFHAVALEYFKKYLVIGGYPSVVNKYIETNDYNLVLIKQHEVFKAINNYIFKNYKGNTSKILNSINSVPIQLFKENKKFQYGVIKKGARQSEYKEPIEWLKKSDILIKCLKVNKINRSISSSSDDSSFKLFFNDNGLLSSQYGIDYNSILDKKWERHLDAILQNYVADTLYSNGHQVYYYESDGKAEIPFVIQKTNGKVIPIDIERRRKAKNITRFTKDNEILYSINLSFDNFSKRGNIKNIPLYAIMYL